MTFPQLVVLFGGYKAQFATDGCKLLIQSCKLENIYQDIFELGDQILFQKLRSKTGSLFRKCLNRIPVLRIDQFLRGQPRTTNAEHIV